MTSTSSIGTDIRQLSWVAWATAVVADEVMAAARVEQAVVATREAKVAMKAMAMPVSDIGLSD